MLNFLILFSVSLVASLSFFFLQTQKVPDWVKENEQLSSKWVRINGFSALSGVNAALLAGLLIFLRYDIIGVNVALITFAFNVGVIGYLLVNSLFTDFISRKVDRFLLRLATLFVAISSGSYVLISGNTHLIVHMIIAVMFFSVLFFFPSVGQSDTRALNLSVIALIPFVDLGMFILLLVLVLVFSAIFSIASLIRQKVSLRKFLKSSVALVPLLMLADLVVVIVQIFWPVI